MSSFDDIDSELDDLLPQDDNTGNEANDALTGKFQMLSSLGGYLGAYQDLNNPGKEDLLDALAGLGIRNAAEDSVYDFLQVNEETTKGFIRSKSGDWIEQEVAEYPDQTLSGDYSTYTKLASFLGLYERYGLDGPNGTKLRNALTNFGVRNGPDEPNRYLAPLEGEDGTERLIGIETGEVTIGYPVDEDGQRVGNDEYTRDLLPSLRERLENGNDTDENVEAEEFVLSLPDDVDNLLKDEHVAENYQLIMHRLAAAAAGEDVADSVRSKKLAEARFITEVLSGERTWEESSE